MIYSSSLNLLAHTDSTATYDFNDHMTSHDTFSSGSFFYICMLVSFILLILAALYLITKEGSKSEKSKVDESPLTIAKKRYASGKITKQQFDTIKKEIK